MHMRHWGNEWKCGIFTLPTGSGNDWMTILFWLSLSSDIAGAQATRIVGNCIFRLWRKPCYLGKTHELNKYGAENTLHLAFSYVQYLIKVGSAISLSVTSRLRNSNRQSTLSVRHVLPIMLAYLFLGSQEKALLNYAIPIKIM